MSAGNSSSMNGLYGASAKKGSQKGITESRRLKKVTSANVFPKDFFDSRQSQ
jgi:hypothetical protein